MAARATRSGDGWWAWTRTLLMAAVLVVAGFGLGVVVGVASEEPELVVGHLAGRSQDVPWHVVDEDSLAPDREAPVVADEPAALPDVAAPPPRAAGYAIQVGAFSTDAAAREVADSLGAKGYPGYVTPSAGARDGRWRVRVGPYDTRAEAEHHAAALKRDEKLPTWVLSEAE